MITFILMVLLSQWLGPEQRGICSFYLVIITATLIISDFAGGSATAYLLGTYAPSAIFKTHIIWSVIPAVIIPAFFFLQGSIDFVELIGLSIAGWLHSAWTILQHLWLGLREYRKFNTFVFLSPLLILVFFLAGWGLGYVHRYVYLGALAGAWFICFVSGLLIFGKAHALTSKMLKIKELKAIFKAGGVNQLAHLVGLAHTRLLYFLLPPTALGVYSNALTITEASFMLAGSVGQIMYSTVTSDRDNPGNKLVFNNLWWIIVVAMSLFIGVILVLPEAWLLWLFGAGFAGVKKYLVYLSGGMLFNSLFLIISYWQSAHGNFMLNLKNLLVGFLVNLAITLLALASGRYSIEVGALGLMLGWLVAALVSTRRLFTIYPGILWPAQGVFRSWENIKQRMRRT